MAVGPSAAWFAARQGWRLRCDQAVEAEQLKQMIEQMQAWHLGGGSGAPGAALDPSYDMTTDDVGAEGGVLPPGAPLVPAAAPGAGAGAVPEHCPGAQNALAVSQARQIKELLTVPADVRAIEASGQFQGEIERALTGSGHAGPTTAAPREAELIGALDRLSSQAALTVGSGRWAQGASPDLSASRGGSEETRWGSSLPADLQRAAPEIYWMMRGEGSSGARDWIAQRCRGSRSNPVQWVDLWTLSTITDFRLNDCAGDVEIMQVLAVDDMM
ncbi:unnamed protein product [Prorocentrum cordatum]|uniref:Uncharacterized protein n=1 Tax=Prorocentrum cordatum TaxID=2364126 RepID=A0ABN9RWE5_9DINO|nr:unnamed protein product [Polarella glacialis]